MRPGSFDFGPRMRVFDVGGDYNTYLLKVLRGDLEEGREHMIRIRFLQTGTLSPEDTRVVRSGYPARDHPTTACLHLAFLLDSPRSVPYRPGWESASAFNINCIHETIPLHPDTDLSLADDLPTRDAVIALVLDSYDRYKGTPAGANAGYYVEWLHGETEQVMSPLSYYTTDPATIQWVKPGEEEENKPKLSQVRFVFREDGRAELQLIEEQPQE